VTTENKSDCQSTSEEQNFLSGQSALEFAIAIFINQNIAGSSTPISFHLADACIST
jgi:hypothetical protein